MKTTPLFARIYAAVALILLTSAAQAIPTQHTYNFTASFVAGAPVTSLIGSITATFDKADVGSGGIDAINFNNGTHSFTISEVGFEAWGGGIIFGGYNGDINGMYSNTNDFWFDLGDFNNLNFSHIAYANAPRGQKSFYYSQSLTLTESDIPEPATLTLFSLGLLGLGALRRKQ